MKRIILFSLCFLLVFAISIVAHTPVSFALKYMPSVRGLSIEGPTGTIWQGGARNISWKKQNLGQVSWDFQPMSLMRGKAQYSVRFGRGSDLNFTGKGLLGVGLSGLYAQNLVVSAPAANILQQFDLPVPLDAQGNIELSVNDYLYAQPWCESANGSLVWNASKISSPIGELDLGTVISRVECAESRLSATGDHDNTQLEGGFTAELGANMRYKVNAWFKPNAEFPQSMKSQLKWLGQPNNKGEYSFAHAGRLK